MTRETPTDVLVRAMEEIEGVHDVIVVARTLEGETCTISTYGNRDLDVAVAMHMLATAQASLIEGAE